MILSDITTLIEDHNNYLQESQFKIDALGRRVPVVAKQVVTGTTKYGTPKIAANTYKPAGRSIGVDPRLMFGLGAAGIAGAAKGMDALQ